jgi:hypothetical protein
MYIGFGNMQFMAMEFTIANACFSEQAAHEKACFCVYLHRKRTTDSLSWGQVIE